MFSAAGKEILTGTKSISAEAARRRSRALALQGRHLLAAAAERSSLSLNSLSEAEDARPPSPTLQRAASEDNLSSSTGEGPSGAIRHQGDSPGSWVGDQKKNTDKKREKSLETKKRKRRTLEVAGQGVGKGKERGWVGGVLRAEFLCLHPKPCLSNAFILQLPP